MGRISIWSRGSKLPGSDSDSCCMPRLWLTCQERHHHHDTSQLEAVRRFPPHDAQSSPGRHLHLVFAALRGPSAKRRPSSMSAPSSTQKRCIGNPITCRAKDRG
eukprot:1913567-Rhodomonas_salina.2